MGKEIYVTLLKSPLHRLLESGGFSDFTIRCRGEEYKVHRNILTAQSKYFEKVCKPDSNFKASYSLEAFISLKSIF